MWEYRRIWTTNVPTWWQSAWKHGEALLHTYGRPLEQRPDTYLVIHGRADVGLKLRGGSEGEVDLKVMHQRKDKWELWEKVGFFRWNDLEAKRFSALLQRDLHLDRVTGDMTPAAGVTQLLAAAAIDSRVVTVEKNRMQARADELVPALVGANLHGSWLAELVEFRARDTDITGRSICVESMSTRTDGGAPLPEDEGVCIGYPEFLLRYWWR